MSLFKIKISSTKLISSNFCKISLKPILQKYSSCLPSFLRCILFTYSSGYAITEVKIYGVNSEFDNIPGIKENALNLILILKGIVFKLKKNKIILYLNKSGESVIKASDFYINEWVEIINPDYIITYLAKGFNLNITIKVEKGVGYCSLNSDNYENKKIDGILLDVNFSPIIRVYYKVKNKIIKKKKFDLIFFFIETNGSISPQEVFISSLNILFSQLSYFKNNLINFNIKRNINFNKKLLIKVSDIFLDPVFLYYFERENIVYLGDLIRFSEKKILKISKMNFLFLKNINTILLKYGLFLNTKIKKWNFNKKKYIKNKYETFEKKK